METGERTRGRPRRCPTTSRSRRPSRRPTRLAARATLARMRADAARTGDADMYPDAVSYTTAARAEAAAAPIFAGDRDTPACVRGRGRRRRAAARSARHPDPQCTCRHHRRLRGARRLARARSPRWPPPSANDERATSPRARTRAASCAPSPAVGDVRARALARASRRARSAACDGRRRCRASAPATLAPSQVPGPRGPVLASSPPPPPRWAAICAALHYAGRGRGARRLCVRRRRRGGGGATPPSAARGALGAAQAPGYGAPPRFARPVHGAPRLAVREGHRREGVRVRAFESGGDARRRDRRGRRRAFRAARRRARSRRLGTRRGGPRPAAAKVVSTSPPRRRQPGASRRLWT